MRRTLLFALLFGFTALGVGCKGSTLPPRTDHLDRDRLRFEWEAAAHKLHDLEEAKSTRPDRVRELHEAQLAVADLEWKLGRLPYYDLHTRRRDVLKDQRCYEHAWLKTGDSTAILEERVNARVQKERWLLQEIGKDEYESTVQAVRQKIAAAAGAHARNEAVAKSLADAAVAEFDAQLAD